MAAPRAPSPSMLDRYRGEQVRPLYTGRVRVTGGESGHGRASGHVVSDDGALDLALRLPPELGGRGGGSNPEQLVAAGYAACFHGAMTLLAARVGKVLVDACVEAAVTFARDPADGLYVVSAEVRVHLPGLDPDFATELVRNTERACPYSKMFRHGISHVVSVATQAAGAPDDACP